MNWGFLGAALARAVAGSASKKQSKQSLFTYSENGRDGRVHCSHEGRPFSLYYEFGGGDALVVISIPTPKDWVAQTGVPMDRREAVLHSIACQVIADKTSTGENRYEITESYITIFDR